MQGVDLALFRAINGWPESWAPLFRFFSEGIDQTPVRLLLLGLIVFWIVRGGSARYAAMTGLLAFPVADLVTNLLKKSVPMPRPCNALADVISHGIGCSNSMGTASAHSANMAAIATVFCLRTGWWGAPWVLIAIVTGLSRVYHGAHFPSQVVLGWACGIAVGFAAHAIAEKVIRRNHPPVVEEVNAT